MTTGVTFKVQGRVYTVESLDQISLKDMLLFERQTDEVGLSLTWADIQRIQSEVTAYQKRKETHPQALLMIAAAVWLARRAAGENVTFGEAIDIPITQFEILPGTEDRKPANPTKGAKKRPASKSTASGRAGAESITKPA